jgi:head-tail adaptor
MFDPTIFQPGELRHNITIQSPSTTRDASGQTGSTWTTVLETRASIESTSSLTFKWSFQNSVLAASVSDCLKMRYPAVDIVPGMQVVWGDQAYLVQDVDDVQRRHRVLVLACVGVDVGSQ